VLVLGSPHWLSVMVVPPCRPRHVVSWVGLGERGIDKNEVRLSSYFVFVTYPPDIPLPGPPSHFSFPQSSLERQAVLIIFVVRPPHPPHPCRSPHCLRGSPRHPRGSPRHPRGSPRRLRRLPHCPNSSVERSCTAHIPLKRGGAGACGPCGACRNLGIHYEVKNTRGRFWM
jgi:hypothetical protein